VLLGQVDALDKHSPVVKNLQYRTAPALILAGRYDYFIAFSDFVHLLYRRDQVPKEPQVPTK